MNFRPKTKDDCLALAREWKVCTPSYAWLQSQPEDRSAGDIYRFCPRIEWKLFVAAQLFPSELAKFGVLLCETLRESSTGSTQRYATDTRNEIQAQLDSKEWDELDELVRGVLYVAEGELCSAYIWDLKDDINAMWKQAGLDG